MSSLTSTRVNTCQHVFRYITSTGTAIVKTCIDANVVPELLKMKIALDGCLDYSFCANSDFARATTKAYEVFMNAREVCVLCTCT